MAKQQRSTASKSVLQNAEAVNELGLDGIVFVGKEGKDRAIDVLELIQQLFVGDRTDALSSREERAIFFLLGAVKDALERAEAGHG